MNGILHFYCVYIALLALVVEVAHKITKYSGGSPWYYAVGTRVGGTCVDGMKSHPLSVVGIKKGIQL